MKKGIHIIRAMYPVLTQPRRPRLVGTWRAWRVQALLYDKRDAELVELKEFQSKLEAIPAR